MILVYMLVAVVLAYTTRGFVREFYLPGAIYSAVLLGIMIGMIMNEAGLI